MKSNPSAILVYGDLEYRVTEHAYFPPMQKYKGEDTMFIRVHMPGFCDSPLDIEDQCTMLISNGDAVDMEVVETGMRDDFKDRPLNELMCYVYHIREYTKEEKLRVFIYNL